MYKLLAVVASALALSTFAFAGCSADADGASTPEARLAETESALATSCAAGSMGAQCLAGDRGCMQSGQPAGSCRGEMSGCLGGEERAMQQRHGMGGQGTGECAMGGGGGGRHGGGGGNGGGMGGHFRPDVAAIRQCHLDARACIDGGGDEAGCLATARTCVQDVIATAFDAMCADHAAACDGANDATCAKLVGMCNRGARDCAAAANP